MGLAVVHGIIQNYQGYISVFSEPGKGTTFKVYFPKIITDAISEDTETAEICPMGSEKVLIVDDDEALVNMTEIMLNDLGYEVTALTSSTLALQVFGKNPDGFDFIITDTNMPEMDGIELVQQIHEMRPGFPVIICTGFSELINEVKASDLGIEKYLMKPVFKAQLARAIRGLLD